MRQFFDWLLMLCLLCIVVIVLVEGDKHMAINDKEIAIVRFLCSQNEIYQIQAAKAGSDGVITKMEYQQLFRYVRPKHGQ